MELDFPLRPSSADRLSERKMPARFRLLANMAVTGPRLRYRFEMCKAMIPRGASFCRYNSIASRVIRWIGIASELKASTMMMP